MDASDKSAVWVGLKHRASWLVGAALVIGACLAIRNINGPESASAKPPVLPEKPLAAARPRSSMQGPGAPAHSQAPPQAAPQKPSIMATVNGVEISRDELGQECVRHYGKEILEGLVNRQLIGEFCRKSNVAVSEQEVQAEIDRMARKFSLGKEQWLKLLEKERGIKAEQYADDIIWPTLALRKLATNELTVSKQELDAACESQFGPGVKVRLIAVKTQQEAAKIRAQAVADPNKFGSLARQYSQDVNSASANGLIQPIRHGLGDPNLEKVAFSLRPGDISPVIPVADQHVILKCEDLLPRAQIDRAHVDPILEEALRDKKLRSQATRIFNELQKQSTVQNVYNDPQLRQQYPGVAAIVNGQKITVRQLQDECIERHGSEVLEGTINHKLLEQALKKKQLAVSPADIDQEIVRAAAAVGKTEKSGKVDVAGWIKTVTEEQGITEDVYRHDAVWPSVALKKLIGDNVQITEDDLKKGFEANYGPRVRCRAIVCSNQRKAQEAWDLARKKPTTENFAKLAEQYSVEATSRSLGGEVPPIQRYGGQPQLEKEAFNLQKGELSGIIQTGENFVILLCEGFTDPIKVEYREVRDMIWQDLHEKKQRVAMGKQFELIKDNAQIDNYLAGTMHTPKKAAAVADKQLLSPQAPVRR